jgi:hypothetical protein
MTVITDNVRLGMVDGMGNGTGSGAVPTSIMNGVGNPSDVVTAQLGSDIFYDSANAQYYMGLGVGGSTWVKLGSVA